MTSFLQKLQQRVSGHSGLVQQPGNSRVPVSTPPLTAPRLAAVKHDVARPSSFLLPLQALLGIITVALFIVTFVVQPFRIPSSSMVPTLVVGDFLLVNRQIAATRGLPLAPVRFDRGQVIVFHYPLDPQVDLIKRIVGLPGDRIRLANEHVYVNDQRLSEPYAVYRPSAPDPYRDGFPYLASTSPEVDSHWWMELQRISKNGELHIPPNEYFVLGDNRNNSEDSRYWGLVPASDIVGTPLLIYFSLRGPLMDGSFEQPIALEKQSFWMRVQNLPRWQRVCHIVH